MAQADKSARGQVRSMNFPEPEALAVDGQIPQEVWAIETEQQLSEALKMASQRRLALIPLGNGTKRHIGYPPERYDVALWLRPLQGIVEHSPEDLTVTVKAGTTLAKLQEGLAQHGQFLPLDPPFPEQTTIGGLIATGMTGPCRCLYGMVREHLLGIKVAQPDGTITRFGGKVMKNVAGYDVTKLYVGSWGTLGVIVEATFKVRPLPEQQVTVPLWAEDLKRVEQFLSQLVLSDVAPAFAELLNANALQQLSEPFVPSPTPYALVLGFDGFREEVAWWLVEAQRVAEAVGLRWGDVLEGELEKVARMALRDLHGGTRANWVLKLIAPSSEICRLAETAQQLWNGQVSIIAHSLNGVLRVMSESVTGSAIEQVNSLLRCVVETGGNLMVEKAPLEHKRHLPLWGQPTAAWQLMRRLKETLDPLRILSPGRLF